MHTCMYACTELTISVKLPDKVQTKLSNAMPGLKNALNFVIHSLTNFPDNYMYCHDNYVLCALLYSPLWSPSRSPLVLEPCSTSSTPRYCTVDTDHRWRKQLFFVGGRTFMEKYVNKVPVVSLRLFVSILTAVACVCMNMYRAHARDRGIQFCGGNAPTSWYGHTKINLKALYVHKVSTVSLSLSHTHTHTHTYTHTHTHTHTHTQVGGGPQCVSRDSSSRTAHFQGLPDN